MATNKFTRNYMHFFLSVGYYFQIHICFTDFNLFTLLSQFCLIVLRFSHICEQKGKSLGTCSLILFFFHSEELL